jgi:protein-S-isoprenylcysteine O-methyltransferase Ste14
VAKWSSIARRIRVPLGFAFAIAYVWLANPTGRSIIAGSTLVILGLLVRALASGHVRKNEELTTSGPYAHTRNPLYLGSILLAAGFVLAARSWWVAGVAVAFFIAVYLPVIRSEEAFLRKKFPEFDDYAVNVPRLLPRFQSYNPGRHSFSWELYWKHSEYNALLGSALLTAVLLVRLFWR